MSTGHFLHVNGMDRRAAKCHSMSISLFLSGFALFVLGLLLVVFGIHGTLNTILFLYGVLAMALSVFTQMESWEAQQRYWVAEGATAPVPVVLSR